MKIFSNKTSLKCNLFQDEISDIVGTTLTMADEIVKTSTIDEYMSLNMMSKKKMKNVY